MKARQVCATFAVLSTLQFTAMAAEPPSYPGASVYKKHCIACHGSEISPLYPGTFALAKTRGEDRAVLTQRRDLNPELITQVVRDGLGFMPSFRTGDLTDADLAQLTRYLAQPTP